VQTVLEIINKCAEYFGQKGVPNPKIDAQLLLASVLGCKRLELFLRFDQPLTEAQLSQFRALVKRREKREPLQHILGQVEFFGLKLKSDKRALVPRPETEELCEIVTTRMFADASASLDVLDLGTGSGAIAAALANFYKASKVLGVDKSDDALDLAKENLELCGLANATLAQSDWFSNVTGKFDIIVANPPYLSDAEVNSAQEEVKVYDPLTALRADDDGLADLRKILSSAKDYLKEGGKIICECGLGQPEILVREFAELYPQAIALNDSSKRLRFFATI